MKKKINVALVGSNFAMKGYLPVIINNQNLNLKIICSRNIFKKSNILNLNNFILENDNQRSIRAYEVKKFTKKSLFDWIKNTKPMFDPDLFEKFFIHPSKDFLLQQINLRVNKMFKQGVKQEVKEFLKLKIRSDLSANKVIGIQEIKGHLVKKLTLTEVKNLIQIRTRQYAKRQFTWARGKMSSWKIINPKNYKDILDTLVN